jgi:hypothetical protein
MSASSSAKKDARVYMALQDELHTAFVVQGGRKISARFRESVSELQENKKLHLALRRFYRRHSEFFSRRIGSEAKQIELHCAADTPDFLQSLSFYIFGYGNVSLISRVILYQYAVHNEWIPEPPVGTAARERTTGHLTKSTSKILPVLSTPDKRKDRRRQSVSVDSLFSGYEITERDLAKIASFMHLRKSATLRYLIEQATTGDTPEEIRQFFVKKWIKFDVKQRGIVRIRYRMTKKLDAALDTLSETTLGYNNRSLILRTIIGYMAIKHGIRKS